MPLPNLPRQLNNNSFKDNTCLHSVFLCLGSIPPPPLVVTCNPHLQPMDMSSLKMALCRRSGNRCACMHSYSIMSHSLGSFVHRISQARILEWVASSFSRGIFPTQRLNPDFLHLLHWKADALPPSHLRNSGNSGARIQIQISVPRILAPRPFASLWGSQGCEPQGGIREVW